jgi:hypothetical protein
LLEGEARDPRRAIWGSPAGDRTFSLVAIGSALFTTLSFDVFGAPSGNDPGRVAANVLTGVGFLGGGMILKDGDRLPCHGSYATMDSSAQTSPPRRQRSILSTWRQPRIAARHNHARSYN